MSKTETPKNVPYRVEALPGGRIVEIRTPAFWCTRGATWWKQWTDAERQAIANGLNEHNARPVEETEIHYGGASFSPGSQKRANR